METDLTNFSKTFDYVSYKIFQNITEVCSVIERHTAFCDLTPKYYGFRNNINGEQYFIEDLRRDRNKLKELLDTGFSFEGDMDNITIIFGLNLSNEFYMNEGVEGIKRYAASNSENEKIKDKYLDELYAELNKKYSSKDGSYDMVMEYDVLEDFRHIVNILVTIDKKDIMKHYNKVNEVFKKLNLS